MKWLALLSALVLLPVAVARADDSADNVVLAVHGGAGVLSKELLHPKLEAAYRKTLEQALRAGHAELQKGTGVDAVVAAIKVLEDSPLFNAGKGGAFTREGKIELDASLMDGATRKAGAVGSVTTIKNPIVGARLVMEKSRHVLMVGPGAELLAKNHGAEIVDNRYFATDLRWKMLQEALAEEKQKEDEQRKKNSAPHQKGANLPARLSAEQRFGTVGCVALDAKGNLAAGTSTGGMTMKLSGRLGDSPIIGAGTYAKNEACAVSATGDGEYFIRAVAAHDIAALVEYKGLPVTRASQEVLSKIKAAGGEGGVIVLDAKGNLALTYNSEGMYRGYITKDGTCHVKIYKD